MTTLLRAENLVKAYHQGTDTSVLKGVDLNLPESSFVALLGASGSGKSTLLHCLGLLDQADQGKVFFKDEAISDLGAGARARFRLSHLGFVFQFHHLIPELSAEENVALPSALLGKKDTKYARELLNWVGFTDSLMKRFPWQLSGGEQQRVALARALINRPALLLTDEATGNLDRPRALEMIALLARMNREFQTTILSVTHDEELARHYKKQYRLKDGRVWDCTDEPRI